MGVASLASTTFDLEPPVFGRWLLLLCLTLLTAGCATKQVVVEGNFPPPLLDPLPITLGVIYPSAFAGHEFFDEAKGRAESDWLVKTGEAQVEFWDILFTGMFDEVVHIRDWETVQSRGADIDGVLIPAIADLQYTIPTHTNVKIYEIWMRYQFRLVDISAIHQQEDGSLSFNPDERLAGWPITAYGKTPTAFLQTDEEAVNLAAVVALRDAGAHFVTTFGATPEVAGWLDNIARRQSVAIDTPDMTTASSREVTADSAEAAAATDSSAADPQQAAPDDAGSPAAAAAPAASTTDTSTVDASTVDESAAQDAAEETESANPTREESSSIETEPAAGEAT
jgi:hypothetical protein